MWLAALSISATLLAIAYFRRSKSALTETQRKSLLATAEKGHAEAIRAAEKRWDSFEPERDLQGLSPRLSPLQAQASREYLAQNSTEQIKVPKVCVVTGGTGFVGTRLVEMLAERGAHKVVSFDVIPAPPQAWQHPSIEYVVGNIKDYDTVRRIVDGADCVWHAAAAVGPFHSREVYEAVNVQGTLNVIKACKEAGVKKIVMGSSPSTRLTTAGCDGLSVAEMPKIPMDSYLQTYAESKAAGEKALTDACSSDLLTVAVAPHQVYGPRDSLFLNAFVEAGITGRLRVFTRPETNFGFNRVCFTHADNYAHALILAERALYEGSPALGKFYIATDAHTHPFKEGYTFVWVSLDQAMRYLGLGSLWAKFPLPDWLLFPAAFVSDLFTAATGIHLKLKVFAVRLMTMHRWFKTDDTAADLQYEPVIPFVDGWADTLVWFKRVWMPEHMASGNVNKLTGLSNTTSKRISIHERAIKQA